jgi:hypothetical protein
MKSKNDDSVNAQLQQNKRKSKAYEKVEKKLNRISQNSPNKQATESIEIDVQASPNVGKRVKRRILGKMNQFN